jgi:hypothetical protein
MEKNKHIPYIMASGRPTSSMPRLHLKSSGSARHGRFISVAGHISEGTSPAGPARRYKFIPSEFCQSEDFHSFHAYRGNQNVSACVLWECRIIT